MNHSKFTAPLIFLLLVSTSIAGCLGERKDDSDNDNVDSDDNIVDSGDNNVGSDDYNVLYIGHSFGKPFADKMESISALAGITNHTQYTEFSGGSSGAPDRLWADDEHRNTIQTYLDTGEIDVLVMICCSVEFKDTNGSSDEAIWNFTAYALEQNPNTRIGLAMPWSDFPENYTNSSEHRNLTDSGFPAWQNLGAQLSEDFNVADVFTFYHGAAMYELREMFEEGNLSDVDQMIGPQESSLFKDEKGHAGDIAVHTGTLLWLAAIYGVEPSTLPEYDQYETDIRLVAQKILDEQNQQQ